MFPRLLLIAAAALGLAEIGEAQGVRVRGQIIHVRDADSIPLPDSWVVLHGVTLTAGAPVDSMRSDRMGRFALDAGVPDSGATYLVSTRYAGIAYFTQPILLGSAGDTVPPLFVYDTSSVAPEIRVAERHVIVRPAAPDGSHRVIELLVLVNRGSRTRLAPDTARPAWQGVLPTEIVGFEVGATDLSADAVYQRGDSVAVAAPMPPGERQIILSYIIPRRVREFVLPIGSGESALNLLVGDSSAAVGSDGVTFSGREVLEGTEYRRYGLELVDSGEATSLTIVFPGDSSIEDLALWVVVPLVGLSLVIGVLLWWRRSAGLRPQMVDADTIAVQIAALDAAFEGTENDAYRQRRAELKAQLVDALARSNSAL